MKWETVTTNHARSIPVERNSEYQFQNLFILKISLFSKDFIIVQKKIQPRRMVLSIECSISPKSIVLVKFHFLLSFNVKVFH